MSFYVGLDLGQVQDYTALAVLEDHHPIYHCRHLERFPLGTPYPEIVRQVKERMELPALRDADLVVDGTGVGVAVRDMLEEAGLFFYTVVITGGDKETNEGTEYRVPKRDLISGVQVLFQSGNLKLAPGMQHVDTLTRELQNFQMKIDLRTAHDSYGQWREGQHDDLVLALALACWKGINHPRSEPQFIDISPGRAQDRGWRRVSQGW